MRKTFFILLIIMGLLRQHHVFAQLQGQALIDSLLVELPKAKEDTNKVKLLSVLTNTYSATNTNEAFKTGNDELALAEKLEWKKGIAYAYADIADIYGKGKLDNPKQLDYLLKSLKIVEELDDKAGIAKNFGNIGNIYWHQHDNEKALDYMRRSLKLFEELGNKPGIAVNLGNIGNVYSNQSDFIKAMEYFSKALKMYEEAGDKKGMARNLGNMGSTCMDIGNLAKSLEYFAMALAISKELDDKYGIAQNLGNVGDAYYSIATETDSASVKLLKDQFAGNKSTALQQAKIYTDSAITINKEIKNLNGLYVAYYQLSDIQSQLGDYKDALESFQQCFYTKDNIYSIEKDKKLTQAAMQYEFDKKEAAVKAEQEKKNLITYIISIALLFVVVVAFITYRSLKRNQKQNQIIREQKEKVEQQNKEKETLLKEIHHRVKNNLQVISSLLELQSGGIDDEGAKAALTEGQNRVKSIALIHQKLYQHENLSAIEMSSFVRDLYRQVASVFIKNGQEVKTVFNVPETLLDIDTAVPLGLVLNEMLTNSFKYAFTPGTRAELSVSLVSENNGSYRLHYSDSGKGLPPDLDLNKSKTLGLRLIRRLSKQIGGKAEYYFDKGSNFIITFTNTETRNLL